MEKSGIGKQAFLNDTRKLVLSVLLVSITVFLIAGAFADHAGSNDPLENFNIILSVNGHDSSNLEADFIHRCALTSPIVATCLIFESDDASDHKLSQVEYIITRDQYLQIPFRERQNWHNHAVELTPERGEPSCISLPDGLECGVLVDILHTTYGKVVTLWDPSDPLPSYPAYTYAVDSPFALLQDLNNNLHNEWDKGDESTSSAGILNEIPEDDEDEDPQCDVSFGDDLELKFRSTGTGDVITLGGFENFVSKRVNYFIGDLEIDNEDVEGDTRFSIRVKTSDGSILTMVVSRIEAVELIEQDCDKVIWKSEGSGRLRDTRRGNTELDFDMFIEYELESGRINVVGVNPDNIEEVIFAFENIVDKNF
jgi:hypothetical protein